MLFFFGALRRHHLYIGLPDPQHGLVLVRRSHRRPPARLERNGFRPLPAFDLQRRGAIFSVLDYSLRPRFVLPQRAHARPHRLAAIRSARAGRRRGVSHHRHFTLEFRHTPLLFHWHLSFVPTAQHCARSLKHRHAISRNIYKCPHAPTHLHRQLPGCRARSPIRGFRIYRQRHRPRRAASRKS